ncbi:MAG: hypothetical protein KDA44_01055 [Planctomycetales bacterium]|nr:hypothetical protein [Planctomycetales bacterium]
MTNSHQLRNRIADIDGGELTGLPSTHHPYAVVFPAPQARVIVYTTKFEATRQLLAFANAATPLGIIGRYGLPRDKDIEGFVAIAHDLPIYFLGDCDPFDLLVFTWLRQHLAIQFLGVSDAVVAALGVAVTERITIALPDQEKRAIPLLREVSSDLEGFVGPNCARMLQDNRKLELEALVSCHTTPVTNLLSLLIDAA